MTKRRWDRERLAVSGVVVLGVVLLGGLWIMLLGRTRGEIQSGGRRAEAPPRHGEIPSERHGNICGVATR